MNPHVRLPLLGLLGLALLAPLSVSRAELSLIVEAPVLSRYRSGADRHDFGGPAGSSIHMSFVFDENYSESHTGSWGAYFEYYAQFDVTRSFAKGAGASLGWNEGGVGYVRGFRSWSSSVWEYDVVFRMSIDDPSNPNVVGYTQFDNFGVYSGPLYDKYPLNADPYFDRLSASVQIGYNSTLYPEDFMKSLLAIGPMNESQMDSFHVTISSGRLADPYAVPSLTAYYSTYTRGDNMEGNDFTAIVAVPEPSTYGIAGVGLLALAGLARGLRGRRRAA